MRIVHLAGWPHPVSALGFGCASLGSRISPKAGVAAIERALDAGINWFDVAPSYGDGEAEAILGDVLSGAHVAIVTKVGLHAATSGPLAKAARAVARPAVSALPRLRSWLKPVRSGAVARLPLNAGTIRASLSRSLERLRVDRVAVLALHEPSLDDLRREEVLRALEEVKREGLAVRIGVAGSLDDFLAANEARAFIDVGQFAVSPVGLCSSQVRTVTARGSFAVTHGVFAAMAPHQLRYAFAANPSGVVLASSFAPQHLRANAMAAAEAPAEMLVEKIELSLRSKCVDRAR